ncbi:MAG: hypothetical protein Q7U13_11780 [Rhodoferax sp.]|nr:hypothetical protein [Rhodoferax sp.]
MSLENLLKIIKVADQRSKLSFNLTGEAPSPTGRDCQGVLGRPGGRAGTIGPGLRHIVLTLFPHH